MREAWEKGLFAIRSAGSGAGTSAYPKPDYILFKRKGRLDIVQCKTTRKYNSYFTPADWEAEVEAARRLRALGFEVYVWLDFTLFKIGRSASINKWFKIDKHEQDALTIKYDGRTGKISYQWTKQ